MNESRKKILNMLAEGVITAEEGEELLSALDESEAADIRTDMLKSPRGRKPAKLRVVVDADSMDEEFKRAKVNIAIPLGLVRTALPIAMSSIPKSARDEMAEKNIDIDGIFKLVEQAIDGVDFDEDIINLDAGSGSGMDAKVRIYFE